MPQVKPKMEGWNDNTCPSCGKPLKGKEYCDRVCWEISSLRKRLTILYEKKTILP